MPLKRGNRCAKSNVGVTRCVAGACAFQQQQGLWRLQVQVSPALAAPARLVAEGGLMSFRGACNNKVVHSWESCVKGAVRQW
jgi:hypothetical protein